MKQQTLATLAIAILFFGVKEACARPYVFPEWCSGQIVLDSKAPSTKIPYSRGELLCQNVQGISIAGLAKHTPNKSRFVPLLCPKLRQARKALKSESSDQTPLIRKINRMLKRQLKLNSACHDALSRVESSSSSEVSSTQSVSSTVSVSSSVGQSASSSSSRNSQGSSIQTSSSASSVNSSISQSASSSFFSSSSLSSLSSSGGFSSSAQSSSSSAGSSVSATLVFSTFIGGNGEDQIRDVDVDNVGNIYVAGATENLLNLGVTRSYCFDGGAAPCGIPDWNVDSNPNNDIEAMDVFVAKINPHGVLQWITVIGGRNYDRAYALELDSNNNIIVAGRAGLDFYTSSQALQTNFAGDINSPNAHYGSQDGFALKLNSNGVMIWSTYFGDAGSSFVRDVDVDLLGNVFVAESAVNVANPYVGTGAFRPDFRGPFDGVLAKISSNGQSLLYASYTGGTGSDGWTPSVRVDKAGNAFLLSFSSATDIPKPASNPGIYTSPKGGNDMYILKVGPTGALLSSTFFGGSLGEFTETHGLALDESGAQTYVYIGASTTSTDLPCSSNAVFPNYRGAVNGQANYFGDGFIAKFNSNLSLLLECTYLGGSSGEGIEGISTDALGNVYVSGATLTKNAGNSKPFPVTSDAYQLDNASGNNNQGDIFVVKLNAALTQVLYGTFLGGTAAEDYGRSSVVDGAGNVHVVGMVDSTNFPRKNALQSTFGGGNFDSALAKFDLP